MPELPSAKYYVFHLVRHNARLFAQTADEEAASQTETNDFFLSWQPHVRQILGAHAYGMTPEWDWMGVFGVNEISDWEAFREEYARRFPGRTERSLSLAGVSHEEFVRATDRIEHYQRLRKLGVYPGGSERPRSRSDFLISAKA